MGDSPYSCWQWGGTCKAWGAVFWWAKHSKRQQSQCRFFPIATQCSATRFATRLSSHVLRHSPACTVFSSPGIFVVFVPQRLLLRNTSPRVWAKRPAFLCPRLFIFVKPAVCCLLLPVSSLVTFRLQISSIKILIRRTRNIDFFLFIASALWYSVSFLSTVRTRTNGPTVGPSSDDSPSVHAVHVLYFWHGVRSLCLWFLERWTMFGWTNVPR